MASSSPPSPPPRPLPPHGNHRDPPTHNTSSKGSSPSRPLVVSEDGSPEGRSTNPQHLVLLSRRRPRSSNPPQRTPPPQSSLSPLHPPNGVTQPPAWPQQAQMTTMPVHFRASQQSHYTTTTTATAPQPMTISNTHDNTLPKTELMSVFRQEVPFEQRYDILQRALYASRGWSKKYQEAPFMFLLKQGEKFCSKNDDGNKKHHGWIRTIMVYMMRKVKLKRRKKLLTEHETKELKYQIQVLDCCGTTFSVTERSRLLALAWGVSPTTVLRKESKRKEPSREEETPNNDKNPPVNQNPATPSRQKENDTVSTTTIQTANCSVLNQPANPQRPVALTNLEQHRGTISTAYPVTYPVSNPPATSQQPMAATNQQQQRSTVATAQSVYYPALNPPSIHQRSAARTNEQQHISTVSASQRVNHSVSDPPPILQRPTEPNQQQDSRVSASSSVRKVNYSVSNPPSTRQRSPVPNAQKESGSTLTVQKTNCSGSNLPSMHQRPTALNEQKKSGTSWASSEPPAVHQALATPNGQNVNTTVSTKPKRKYLI